MIDTRTEYLAYQGVDCQKFKPQNILYNPIPGDTRPTLLFVGRLAREKNITQLLHIFPIVSAKIPDIQLIIVGTGPQEEELRELVQRLRLNIYIWGISTGTELLGWFSRADVFVNPSITENFCTTTNEALASGTPVVACISSSTSEQVNHGQNGFLAEPNNPLDFANKVISILENPLLKANMSKNDRSFVLKYDWPNCMNNFETKLYKLIREYSISNKDKSLVP
ncbi:glycosyltransferase family 4 protein [Synechococcus sp. PCC 7336]|uniref:glycosyltransferase family 4 protein n=1 Tax=Synechococcus sp. PCC 7336 TaxID=195250 RepID=UPI000349443D|nr:glycosyltransferase family 4 protein [Synechococcus sp. PCC 7336]